MQIAPDTLDVSALDEQDLVNLVLQRSDGLGYNRAAYDMVRDWKAGDPAPLMQAVREQGETYARRAAEIIRDEFATLRGLLERLAPRSIADIGCGYGIFDLYAHHLLGCDLLLIDIEHSETRHFGFRDQGAGYSSLASAARLLADNGVPAGKIRTWNPNRDDMPVDRPVDLAVSFLSCGFHYPVDMYLPFFRYGLAPRGAVILDLRSHHAPGIIAQLEELGRVRILRSTAKVTRILLKKRDPE